MEGYEIHPFGYIEVQIESDSRINLIKFVVVKGKGTPILGLKYCLGLDIIRRIDNINIK